MKFATFKGLRKKRWTTQQCPQDISWFEGPVFSFKTFSNYMFRWLWQRWAELLYVRCWALHNVQGFVNADIFHAQNHWNDIGHCIYSPRPLPHKIMKPFSQNTRKRQRLSWVCKIPKHFPRSDCHSSLIYTYGQSISLQPRGFREVADH